MGEFDEKEFLRGSTPYTIIDTDQIIKRNIGNNEKNNIFNNNALSMKINRCNQVQFRGNKACDVTAALSQALYTPELSFVSNWSSPLNSLVPYYT